ncbi:MAG: preprotein translocase subunit SecE [Desulfobulbaceae bacterium]|nr:preprotein translocase subunit SecE [Desulfobulbaceae bacterium]
MSKKGKGAKVAKKGKGKAVESTRGILELIPQTRLFIQEVKNEFTKIVWPEKKATFGLTGFVLVLVFIISIYLGSVDLLLGKIVSLVLQ